ncbi:MAG: hypothetical protein EFKGCFLK_01040 [Rhodocyclaceae bacterium]|nr:hypothetical protein [Rhodocyclaceae bacterium]
MSDSQHSLTSSFSSGRTRRTRSCLTWTIRLAPRPSCGLTDFRRDSSQVRAAKRKGFEVSAPTGQRSMTLPDSSESTVFSMKGMISACSPRKAWPISCQPAISCVKRTQRVQWMQRVMSVAMSGPRFLFTTTRFSSW